MRTIDADALEDEEFCTLLLEYLNNKKSKLREELDKL